MTYHRRLRGKLSQKVRRLFDSNDLLWCTAASLDRYLVAGRLDIERPEQLWALIFRIGECEAARLAAIAARHSACELDAASLVAPRDDPEQLELPHDLSDADRELLMLRGRGCSLALIARLQGLTHAAVRKRWERLRRRLRETLRRGGRDGAPRAAG